MTRIHKEKPPIGRLFSRKILCILRFGCPLIADNSALHRSGTIGRPLAALLLYGCRVSLADKNSVRLFTKGYVFFFERTVFIRMMATAITTS